MSTELGLSLARCSAAAPQRRRPSAPRLVVEGMPREQAAPWAGGAHGGIDLLNGRKVRGGAAGTKLRQSGAATLHGGRGVAHGVRLNGHFGM